MRKVTNEEIQERYNAIAKCHGMATTPSGKKVFVLRVSRDTGIARIMYFPSEKRGDILITKLAARSFEIEANTKKSGN